MNFYAAQELPRWQDDPWVVVKLDGETVPGPCEVRLAQPVALRSRQEEPYRFTVMVTVGERNQAEVDRFLAVLWRQVRPGAPPKPRIFRVEHPELQMFAVREAVVVGISSENAGPVPGTKVITLSFVESAARTTR